VERHHRQDRDTHTPLIVRNEAGSSYVLLGLPSGDPQFPRVWVILNAIPGGIVEYIPRSSHFVLACASIADLQKRATIDPKVREFLVSRCQP